MNIKSFLAAGMLICILVSMTTTQAHAQMANNSSGYVMVLASDLKWTDGPPTLPAGIKMAVLDGDPGGTGLFTIRLMMPANTKIMPHYHPTDENITVLKGNFKMAVGDKFDEKALKDMPVGGFMSMKKGTHHFAMAQGETEIQLHAIGPFVITYVNPEDDPSKKK